MDEVFEQEQLHLRETYAKLLNIERHTSARLSHDQANGTADIGDLRRELTLDFSDSDSSFETAAEIETVNSVVDAYNIEVSVVADRLRKTRLLLEQPYFAKIQLQFPNRPEPRDIYIGTVGMTDDNRRHFIVDWRSPIAEVYYNQDLGPTSYKVDDRTIHTDLKVRRQFDIKRDKLKAYFDTSVAIEDPLLLASLGRQHTEKLKAITATIQKEQNTVIRHDDVDVLLVSGIAGSGKTSVLLQRIAYLFYRQRDNLNPEDVYLLSPNPVFGSYIDSVLPDMGERNPHIFTWRDFMKQVGLGNRGSGANTNVETLKALSEGAEHLTLQSGDIRPIVCDGVTLLKTSSIQNSLRKHENLATGPRLIQVVNEELADKLANKLRQMAVTEDVQDEMKALSNDEQLRIFGQQIAILNEEDADQLALVYLNDRFAQAFDDIEHTRWIDIDHIGARLIGKSTLTAVEWLFLKMLVAGDANRRARYVMIDEVQDYTVAQLIVLSLYFCHAHFMLLGDPNQAIFPGTASFPEIEAVFSATRGTVDRCELNTSYRSSPEITDLFSSLLAEEERGVISSVQHAGYEPHIIACDDDEEYIAALRHEVAEARKMGDLCAIVANDRRRLKWIAKQLDGQVTLMQNNMSLPERGIVLIELALAKGLEFDQVIIPDAQKEVFPDTPLARRRLYTTISRATHRVSILAQGELTPLLKTQ